MDISFNCDGCGQHINAASELVRQTVNCPACGKSLFVPKSSTVTAGTTVATNDITFDCYKCGQNIVIDETGAGQLVDCPKCGTVLEVPYKSKILDKLATSALPPKPTPAQTATQPPPSSLVSTPAPRVSSERWIGNGVRPNFFTPSEWSQVCKELEACYELITTSEIEVCNEPVARQALAALRQIQASVQVGVTCENYALVIGQVSLPVNDFVGGFGRQFPACTKIFSVALFYHQQLLSVWRSLPTSGARFWGGGFGVVGFLVGAAISTGLNTVIGAGEAKVSQELTERLQGGWLCTGAFTNMLEDALSQ